MAHGIENPDDRTALGKAKFGSLVVKVVLEESSSSNAGDAAQGWLDIRIEDDGQGVNPEAIRTKLRELGKEEEAESESDSQVIQHIFDGFSTKEVVTDVSGRGVGLSAVKEEVTRLGGTVRVESILGKQTVFHMRVPYLWKGKVE